MATASSTTVDPRPGYWVWGAVLAWLIWVLNLIFDNSLTGRPGCCSDHAIRETAIGVAIWLAVVLPVLFRWRVGFLLTAIFAGFFCQTIWTGAQDYESDMIPLLAICFAGFVASVWALFSTDIRIRPTPTDLRAGALVAGSALFLATGWGAMKFWGSFGTSCTGPAVQRAALIGQWAGAQDFRPRVLRLNASGSIDTKMNGRWYRISAWELRGSRLHFSWIHIDGAAIHHSTCIELTDAGKTLTLGEAWLGARTFRQVNLPPVMGP